ncbi:MAG: resolvase [Candidatus Margulisiibacteriota bacterium]
MIIAIDPGKDKCGLAILESNGKVRKQKVYTREDILKAISDHTVEFGCQYLIIGKSHHGKQLEKEISRLDLNASLIFVSEKNSTLEARKRYWQENKPNGLLRIIPATLRVPPVPIDDYAAVILGERYLKG